MAAPRTRAARPQRATLAQKSLSCTSPKWGSSAVVTWATLERSGQTPHPTQVHDLRQQILRYRWQLGGCSECTGSHHCTTQRSRRPTSQAVRAVLLLQRIRRRPLEALPLKPQARPYTLLGGSRQHCYCTTLDPCIGSFTGWPSRSGKIQAQPFASEQLVMCCGALHDLP